MAEAASGQEVWRSEATVGLAGQLLRLVFYHNQLPAEGVDRYDQDRGISSYRKLTVTAAALVEGDPAAYRDADLRGPDPRTPPAFNRAMRWLGPAEGVAGTVLAYDEGAALSLTGKRQVASWLPNRLCTMQPSGPTTSLFTRPNDLDGYDRVALQTLQWCVRQHPVLEYDLRPGAGKCYLKVCLVEPYLGDGIEVFRSRETTEAVSGKLDLGRALADHGLGYHQFGEIDHADLEGLGHGG